MDAIHVKNLVKSYKNGVCALNGISLTVKSGEIFSLLGENGAGKSTLINVLTTYLRPTSGDVTMFEKDIYSEAPAIRSKIACVAQRISIDTHLSLRENMMFQSKLHRIPKNEAKKRMEILIDCFGLESYLKYPVSSYSGGIKRRLDIALNMMSNPKILFLDEPTVGMDVKSRTAMWDMMKKIRTDFGTTIFLTTHYLEEADALSDTICIMKDGKEILQGTPDTLRDYLQKDILEINLSSKEIAQNCYKQLVDIFNLESMEIRGVKIIVTTKNSHTDLEIASRFLVENRIKFTGIQILQPSLEDVFIRLTSENIREVS